jgi:hypothetical protein
MRKLGIPPESLQPNRYVGPKANLIPCVEANRRPSVLDRQYPLLTMWRVDSSPTSGDEGEVWQLVKFETSPAGNATWKRLDFSNIGPGFDSFTIDSFTAPGVNPVEPNGVGNVTLIGAAVANHGVPLETHSRALNSFNAEIQVSIERFGAPPNKLDAGICSFDDSAFSVDASGYVTLVGGLGPAVDGIDVDFNTLPGVDPVVPDGAGVLSLFGNVVANATNLNSPVATHSRAVNQSHIDVQLSTAITVPADPFDVGLASFDSAVFSVDPNGWVSLAGGGLAVDSFTVDSIAGTGVNPVVATAAGLVTVGGGVVVNANIPLQSISRAPNEYDLEIQVAKAVTGAPGAKTGAGVATFDDTKFTVDTDGYVTSIGSGPGGAGIVFLATATAATSATLEFTALIDATYNSYLFIFDHLRASVDSVSLNTRTSANAGVSYDSGASDYSRRAQLNFTLTVSGSASSIGYVATIGDGANDGLSGYTILYNPSEATYTELSSFVGSHRTSNTTSSQGSFFGRRVSAAACDAIQFYMSSGTITSGTIKMYGMTTPA